MGVFDKLKDWFGDDEFEEEVETVKTQVQISTDEAAEKENITETPVLKKTEEVKPEKPKLEIFNDDDFKDMVNTDVVKKAREKVQKSDAKKELKVFRPSPIISPVYGILDKNYAKEDIAQKRSDAASSKKEDTGNIDIDWIRKKAYGTLDDDLEQELFKDKHVLVDEQFVQEKDLFDELDAKAKKEADLTDDEKEKLLEDSFFYEKRKEQDKITAEKEATDEQNQTVEENQLTNEDSEEKKDLDVMESSDKEENLEKDEPTAEEAMAEDTQSEEVKTTDNQKNAKEKMGEDLFNLIDNMYDKEES